MSDYATNNIQSILDHPEYKPGQGYRLDTLRKFVIHLLAERAELSTLQEKSASQDLIYAILLGGAQDFPSPPPLETLATHVAGKAAKYDDTDAAEVERLQAAIDATADKLGIDRHTDHSHYETLDKIGRIAVERRATTGSTNAARKTCKFCERACLCPCSCHNEADGQSLPR